MNKNNHERLLALREAVRDLIRALGVLNHPYSQYGLHLSQCHAMIELGRRPNLNILQLAQYLNLERSTVSRLIKQLEQQKLVLVMTDPQDKRSKLLALTEQGQVILDKIHAEGNSRFKPVIDTLSNDNYQAVVQGIHLCANALMGKS